MPNIVKTLELGSIPYYETHLSIVNCILPLASKMTPTEIKVLANFMALEGNLTLNRFGPTAKKIVMAKLGIKDAGLSNYLKQLTDKKCISKIQDTLVIKSLLQPDENQQQYMYRLTKIKEKVDAEL